VSNVRERRRITLGRHWPWLALPGALLGCASPVAPPVPPGGGPSLQLDYATFASAVEPILVARGCDAGGDCHGGGIRGTLQLSPAAAKDTRFDFDQVSLQVTPSDPDGSPILTEPLAVTHGGTPHSVKVFADTSDADYRTLRAWVRAGVAP
jgi:hypothetical protein